MERRTQNIISHRPTQTTADIDVVIFGQTGPNKQSVYVRTALWRIGIFSCPQGMTINSWPGLPAIPEAGRPGICLCLPALSLLVVSLPVLSLPKGRAKASAEAEALREAWSNVQSNIF
jgi:hypothetical protein